ncbi:MAG: type II CAAX endopeptidase family protein [bacterium]|nr:type II CAAX endopeptidase family protein [bacterium]
MNHLLENILIPLFITIFPIFVVRKNFFSLKRLAGWTILSLFMSFSMLGILRFEISWSIILVTTILTSLFILGMNHQYINRNKIVKSLLVIGLFFCSSIFQLIPILLLNWDPDHLNATQESLLTIFSNMIFCIILFFLYQEEIKKEFKDFRNRIYPILDTAFKYWFIGIIVMVFSNLLINLLLPSATASNEETVQKIIQAAPLLSIISVGILAPIIEEFTFRKAFYDIFSKPWLFIMVSGIIFGGLHVVLLLQGWQDLFYLIPYCSLGVAFGFILVKTDNIFASIAVHMFHNTCLTILSIISAAMVVL